ncbi:MAG TPA: prephenate dehydrogenase/arogenate dehydrogenase family protein, partial [Solirubrobacteraceae bacterium]|nr:prephenate dehydrogenase/arogenate dehydrogenase family protein [Solirubrobacteraceae bacterium]
MNVAVVGVGLIGGSVGLAARRRLGATVRGVDPAAGDRPLRAGAVDAMAGGLQEALDGADAAFVCVPVGALAGVVADVLAVAPPGCVVTDVGSTKRAVATATTDERFVGGHPLAGAEAAGVEHARADLFDQAAWYLTPTPATSGVLLERLHRLLTGLGARPVAIDAETHDRVMAAVSHLPHVVANVLVAQAAAVLGGGAPGRAAPASGVPVIGPSFRDATRVAGAHPALWREIYAANADALATAIDDAVARLRAVRALLEAGDLDALGAWQAAAGEDRRALLEAGLAGGPLRAVRLAVPNRPGVIAELALALGRAGINIADLALSPSADGTTGEVALWVP